MEGKVGTIVELDVNDAVGWIELDEGGRVRFGGTALDGFTIDPGPGTRVEVVGTTAGYQGVLKAVKVRPVDPQPSDEYRYEPVAHEDLTPWPAFVRDHPRWSDAADTCMPCARRASAPTLPRHPLFAPWLRQICEGAPTVVGLVVPKMQRPDGILEPGATDSFAHGRVAFLDEPRWPSCGICARPLEMCLQLAPAIMADWIASGLGLVAMFCFHCGFEHLDDPRIGHVRLIEPRHRVVGPEGWKSASSGWQATSQRVTARAPFALPPSASWIRCRSELVPDTASSALIGPDEAPVTGPFPEDLDEEHLDDIGATYDDWVAEQEGGEMWAGANLGGVAEWNHADDTPSCSHGEMLHLLDYDGGQFLDGALHVFACREQACELRFVAEF